MQNIHLVNGYNVLFIRKDKEYDTTIIFYMYVKNGLFTNYKLFLFIEISIFISSLKKVLQSVVLYGSNGKFTNKRYFTLCENSLDNDV